MAVATGVQVATVEVQVAINTHLKKTYEYTRETCTETFTQMYDDESVDD